MYLSNWPENGSLTFGVSNPRPWRGSPVESLELGMARNPDAP